MYPLVYIARHGQTEWNAEHRLQGQADTDLNDFGREQATQNGRRLAELVRNPADFDFVASPMRRTRETMELMREAMGLDPTAYRTDPRLVGIRFGDWQGFTFAELEERAPGSTDGRRHAKWDFQPPGEGAESWNAVEEEVKWTARHRAAWPAPSDQPAVGQEESREDGLEEEAAAHEQQIEPGATLGPATQYEEDGRGDD